MGRGTNAVEWLTIQNGVGTGLIETDLPPTSEPTHIRVAHVILQTGAARGIDFRIMGSAFNGKTIDGVFESNVIRNITRANAEGMRAYLQQAVSATMNVTLRNNSFTGNQIGLLAANNTSSTSTITIDSAGDQFRDNRAGCWLIAGIGSTSAGNVLVFTAQNDQFNENNRAQTANQYTTGGGIVAMGAALHGHDNRTRLEVLDSHFSGNTADISVYGYYDPRSGDPGIHNVLELRPSAITPTITPSDPPDPSNTNTVILLPPIPTLTVNSTYCTGTSWSLQVSTAAASSVIRLLGSSNGVTWEIPRWRTTQADGTFTGTGTFPEGTQGSHTLRLEIAGTFSRTISFVVSDCRQ